MFSKALNNSRSARIWLLSDSNLCSTSAELCITVETGEDEAVVVISCPDHFHKLRSDTTRRQTTIYSVTVQKKRKISVGFLGQNGLSRSARVKPRLARSRARRRCPHSASRVAMFSTLRNKHSFVPQRLGILAAWDALHPAAQPYQL